MGEQGVTLVAAIAVAVFIIVVIWLLNGPSRRRVADLERRLDDSRQEVAARTGGQSTASTNESSSATSRATTSGGTTGRPGVRRPSALRGESDDGLGEGPDADVIELRPRGQDRTIDNLKHELAVTRDELLRWRAMSDDFERRWRHEMMSVEQLEAEVDALRAAETDARRAIDDIKTRLVTLAPDETSALVAVEGGDRAGDTGGGAETEVGHGAGHDRESDADVAIDKDAPEVIDLRDRRSDLEDRLSRLAAELDDVRRELSSDEE